MRAANRYLQITDSDSFEEAAGVIRSLSENHDARNNVSVFCSESTAQYYCLGPQTDSPRHKNSPRHRDASRLLRELNERLLGGCGLPACHQRLSALGERVLVVGALASGAVTGSLAMFFQQHSVPRSMALEHERKVAEGQFLIAVSCGGKAIEVCDEIYATLAAQKMRSSRVI